MPRAGEAVAAFGAAVRQTAKVKPPPAAARAHAAILAGMRNAARAYGQIVAAIAADDSHAFRRAAASAKQAEIAVQRGFDSLRPLGYFIQ